MPAARARVEMIFGDGTIDTWNKISLHQSFVDPLDAFTFESIPPQDLYADYRRRLGKGEKVTLRINDVPQGDYLIVTSDRTSSEAGLGIEVTCHTPLWTPHQGDVDPDLKIDNAADVSVADAVLRILGPYGFTRIVTDTRGSVSVLTGKPIGGPGGVATDVETLTYKDLVGHENETAYAAIARLVTRLGVVLRMAPDGTLLVCAPDYDQTPSYTVVRTTRPGTVDGDYFVGPVKVHDTNEGQFSECHVRGQRAMQLGVSSTARPDAGVQAADVLPSRSAYTSSVAPFCPKYIKDKRAPSPEIALNVAHLELGARAANAFTVEGAVHGWVASTGALWTVNTMALLVHEPEEINEPFWVSEVTRTQSADATGGGGQMTRIKLIPSGALILGAPKK